MNSTSGMQFERARNIGNDVVNGSDLTFGPAYSGDDRRFDFTLLFEDTIFTILPASLFLMTAAARAIWLCRQPNKVASSVSRASKLIVLSAFSAIQLAVLLLRATNQEVSTKASVAAATLDFATGIILFLLSGFEHRRSIAPSTVIGAYLFFSCLFDAIRLRSFYSISGLQAQGVARLLSLSLATKIIVLVTEAVDKRGDLLEPYRLLPPEQTNGIYSKTLFWWVNPMLKVGFSHSINTDDLYILDTTLASEKIHEKFHTHWKDKRSHRTYSLIWTTISVLKWQLLISAIPRLALAAARFAQPFLVQATLRFIIEKQDIATGWGLVAAWTLVYMAVSLLTGAYRHLLNRCCVQIRGGLVSMLYRKTLELSIVSQDPTAAMSLMSTDIERLVNCLTLFHDIWAGPLELGVAMYLLYLELGRACYAPAIVYALQLLGTVGLAQIIAGYQKTWLEAVQKRVSFTSALLHSMRNVKLLGLSAVVKDRTHSLRINEVRSCRAFRFVDSIRVVLQNSSSIFAPFATFLLYYLQSKSSGKELDIGAAFSVLTILRIMDSPLNLLIFASVALASSMSCFERLQDYLLSPSQNDNRLSLHSIYDDDQTWGPTPEGIPMRRLSIRASPADEAISMRSCSFGWDQNAEPEIKDIDVSIKAGSLTMVIGPVGCGKSTLLKGMLSETPLLRGFIYVQDHAVAFVDQQPWIQNGTIRDSVYSSSSVPPEAGWYDEVLWCCALTEDVTALPKGDLTCIGSKGISLSGGQKQRLALARAVFSRSQILVLDDVFSGLDNDTEEVIFKRLFAKDGPLRRFNTTVVLATHAVRRLPYADFVISLDRNGTISEMGSPSRLMAGDSYVRALDVEFKHLKAGGSSASAEDKPKSPAAKSQPLEEVALDTLSRRTGEWRTWKSWFKSCGYLSSSLSFIWGFLWISACQVPGILVRVFASNNALRADDSATLFISIFGLTSFLAAIMVLAVCYQILLDMQPRSAKAYHIELLTAVLNAPLWFFTKTDIGSITNRFSQDLSLVDTDLPFGFADFVLSLVSAVTGIALMIASGSGYFAATIPILIIVMYFLQKFYLRTSRQMRLLDIEEKAPLYTQFDETAAGLATIRAFGWTGVFMQKHLELLDRSQRPFYLLMSIQQWLALVLGLMVTGLVGVLMTIVVLDRDSIDAGLIGVGLLAAVTLSNNLSNLVTNWTNMETSIGAINRIGEFVRSTVSEHLPIECQEPPSGWPDGGRISFNKFSASYSPDSQIVLDSVDLSLYSGEKLGVCGRSGSGKSSTLASLFHLLEFRAGKINLDSIDISTIPREALRSRLNVIPQEPWWLTTETVRYNMNPWQNNNSEDNDAIYIAELKRCQVWDAIKAKGGLDAIMTPDFLSHGQRQLFCLARALLRPGKVVILDEVSANVDVQTDQVMHEIIRERFSEHTMIAVAHRLNTIDRCDRVAVLHKGRIEELGEPGELLQTAGSRYKQLCEL